MVPEEIRQKLQRLREELQNFFKERDDEVVGMIVALLSGQHMLLIGPAGTGKSLMARTLCEAIVDARFHYYLLDRFTTPRDLLAGEVIVMEEECGTGRSIRFRNSEGVMLTSELCFLDEIFKANNAHTLNSLLLLLNEREYSVNPGEVKKAPLITMIGASNELPGKDRELALQDRFLLRYAVDYLSISQDGSTSFEDMLNGTAPKPETTITLDELRLLQAEVDKVEIDGRIIGIINSLRATLILSHNIRPSDRRYKESLKVLKAHAYLRGRSRVEGADISILRHVLWTADEERETVAKVISEVTEDSDFIWALSLFGEAEVLYREARSLLQLNGAAIPFDEEQRRAYTERLEHALRNQRRLDETYAKLDGLGGRNGNAGNAATISTFRNRANIFRKDLIRLLHTEDAFIGV